MDLGPGATFKETQTNPWAKLLAWLEVLKTFQITKKKKKKHLLTNLKTIPKVFNQLPCNIEKNISVANFLIIKISNCCTLPRKHEPHFYFWVNYHFDF